MKLIRVAKKDDGSCGGYGKPKGKLDTQLFPECEDTKYDRDIVKKQEKKSSSCNCEAKKKTTEEAEKFKYNPWAVCTKSVGRDDEEKYERCVKKVKQKERKKLKEN